MPLALKPQKKVSEIDFDVVELLSEELSLNKLFAQILYNRGLETVELCREFLYPDENSLLDPFSMLNMAAVVEKISYARENGKKITVYGDYDVDGISATAILYTALTEYGVSASYYIPDRHTEGYGLNENAVNAIFEGGTDIIITVDCGIASAELISKQLLLGREMIVTDHHNINLTVPPCLVLKPGQPNDTYQNTELCGAGVAFKLAQALLGEKADRLIDYACIATIADVVSLRGENRYIVKKGLECINDAPRDCFKALLEASEFKGTVTSQSIGFVIAPRLNAAGRMESASTALELLLASGDRARELALILCEQNKKRQEAEKCILENAEQQILENGFIRKNKVLVVAGEGWDDGVIGICASRLTEKYKRPTLMFSIGENGIAKGSGRSVEGIDLFAMLSGASDILIQFGGHKMAAGMSIEKHKLPLLRQRLDEILVNTYDLKLLYPSARYDAKAKTEDITMEFCKMLSLMEPCGSDNPEVTLRVDNCIPGGMKRIGAQKNHLKLYLQDDSGKLGAVAFNYEKHNCDYMCSNRGSAIVRPEINVWQDTESVSLKIADFKETENLKPRQRAEELTACFYSRLSIPKTGKASVEIVEDPEELNYMISQWDDDDIAGTLILCDHPEYAAGCISILENEAPRFDVSMYKPINNGAGYNSLVIGAEINSIDLTRYNRVVFFDLINMGYADSIREKAPWLKMYALKCGLELFDSLFSEYKQLTRENMMTAYRAICRKEGVYENFRDYLEKISDGVTVTMPIIAVALKVFCELEFITVTEENGFSVRVNREAQRRTLDESRFYNNILKCVGKGI